MASRKKQDVATGVSDASQRESEDAADAPPLLEHLPDTAELKARYAGPRLAILLLGAAWDELLHLHSVIRRTDEGGKYAVDLRAMEAAAGSLRATLVDAESHFRPLEEDFSDCWTGIYTCYGRRERSPAGALLQAMADMHDCVVNALAFGASFAAPDREIHQQLLNCTDLVGDRNEHYRLHLKEIERNLDEVLKRMPGRAEVARAHEQLSNPRTKRLRLPVEQILKALATLAGPSGNAYFTWDEIGGDSDAHLRHSSISMQKAGVIEQNPDTGQGQRITPLGRAVLALELALPPRKSRRKHKKSGKTRATRR